METVAQEISTARLTYKRTLIALQQDIDQHIPQLESMGIIQHKTSVTTSTTEILLESSEKITITKHWWGIGIEMNEKLTQDIIDGIIGTGAVGAAIATALGIAGVITSGIALIIAAGIAGVVAIKIAQIKITNNGKGVHWPITWAPQWAALIAAAPKGPAAVLAAGALFLHPLQN